jgi:uncharacterized protein (TIGR00725 family)
VKVVAVVGPADASAAEQSAASAVGEALAARGITIVCGGLGGVMEAACAGARSCGGVTIGLLPGLDRADANRFVSVPIPTGLGELRNGLIVRACDGMVAVGSSYGTLSEIALALRAGKRVVGVASYAIEGVEAATGAADAVERLLA